MDVIPLHERIQKLVLHLAGTGVAIRDMVKLIANLNDQVLIRLIHLLRNEKYPDLSADFAFVVMGSEGRGEQTLSTDQDNAIIYDDALDAAQVSRLEAFSQELIDALISIGVPPCPGGIMAKNPQWRRSLSGWKVELNRWLSTPTPDNVMTGSMFMDLRALYGRGDLVGSLREHAFRHMSQDQGFLMRMAQNMTNFHPPLGWFGRWEITSCMQRRKQILVANGIVPGRGGRTTSLLVTRATFQSRCFLQITLDCTLPLRQIFPADNMGIIPSARKCA